MTLMNFDNEIDLPKKSAVVVTTVVPEIVSTVSVSPVRDVMPSSTHLLTSNWDWRQLRDYVITEIEKRFGVQPRLQATREASIFKSFLTRFPDGLAVRIAQFAFDVEDGWWSGAPIAVTRFCVASDEFFARPIVERLGA
jgi:hypothetical protein